MCVAHIGKVMKNDGKTAEVDFDGVKMNVRSALVDVKPDDDVLVHAGIIIQKLTKKEAREMKETEALLRETGSVNGGPDGQ